MRRLVVLLAGVSVLMLWPLTAHADGPYEFATGSGERGAVPGFAARRISFSAHNGPNGASGHVRSHGTGLFPQFNDFSGPVACLRVDGNRAVIGAVIENAAIEEREGWGVVFAVEDNGDPADAAPDRLSVSFLFPSGTPDCTIGTTAYATLTPITSGNFTVYDAS